MLQKTYLVVSENSGSRLYRMQGDMASTRYHVQRSYASRGDVREDAYACTCNFSSRILNKVREIHVVFSCLPLFRESPKCGGGGGGGARGLASMLHARAPFQCKMP